MDASTITKLRAKQLTQYTNRNQTMDSSTLTWMQQVQSARVCSQPPTAVTRETCCGGGQGRDTALSTGSTQRFPNVLAGAMGSASRVYSSELLTLQKAGASVCAMPSADGSYIQVSSCDCSSTNGPTADLPQPPVNNQSNEYLPAFDTYHRFKNPCTPVQDVNQKHQVPLCVRTNCVME